MVRTVAAAVLAALLVVGSPEFLEAQGKVCKKGKPCGNTCIARNKTCRVGQGTARSAAEVSGTAAPAVPADAQFVASSRGRVYYWVGCAAWKRLSPANLHFFTSRAEAERAGYTPSRSPGCAGPTGLEEGGAGLGASGAVPPTASGSCTVEAVLDGDTVRCAGGETVRLLLIDAPETDQGPYGLVAKAELERLLPVGAELAVELDLQERDRYGRVLAYLYLPDGRLVNEELVRRGYAVLLTYPPNVRHVERIRAAAEEAREARRGLWSGWAFECSPADHRAGGCE